MPDLFSLSTVFSSPEATAAFAAALAPALRKGDTILLKGEIGAGKSHFARAFIGKRLDLSGRSEEIPSPTYTLVQTYNDGVCEIWHADLYRLTSPDEIGELGLEDAFPNAICLVEWPDRLGPYQPDGALEIELSVCSEPGARLAKLSSSSRRWRGPVQRALEVCQNTGLSV